MKRCRDIYKEVISFDNLELAFKKARKNKSRLSYVIEFEKYLTDNLLKLKNELETFVYKPRKLKTFIIRDPKTRKISKSAFRDRVVHHALCNIIEPIFDKSFIYDSYANRKGKGTLKAIERFDEFKREVSKNNTINVYVLKADIKHYFETVDHNILLNIINRKIKDGKIIWLIKIILENYDPKENNKGMPLGNLTSQFFANIYLDDLDEFVKYNLKIKYYIRYVDDFVILDKNKEKLEYYKKEINNYLKNNLKIELHPGKSKIVRLDNGLIFLGFKIFYNHKLLKKNNIVKFRRKLITSKEEFEKNEIDYDKIYSSFEGFLAYVKQANTFRLRQKIIKDFEEMFPNQISSIEIGRLLKN